MKWVTGMLLLAAGIVGFGVVTWPIVPPVEARRSCTSYSTVAAEKVWDWATKRSLQPNKRSFAQGMHVYYASAEEWDDYVRDGIRKYERMVELLCRR